MKKLVIWGTGARAKCAFEELIFYHRYQVVAFADNDIEKVGSIYCNLPVWDEETVKKK